MHPPEIEEPMQNLQTSYFLAASIARPSQKCITFQLKLAILPILWTGWTLCSPLFFFIHPLFFALISFSKRPESSGEPNALNSFLSSLICTFSYFLSSIPAVQVYGRTECFAPVCLLIFLHILALPHAYKGQTVWGEPNALLPFFSLFLFTIAFFLFAYNG